MENPVKETCRILGITQKELAVKMRITENTIGNWVSGRVEIPPSMIKMMELLVTEKKYLQAKEAFEKSQ